MWCVLIGTVLFTSKKYVCRTTGRNVQQKFPGAEVEETTETETEREVAQLNSRGQDDYIACECGVF